MTIDWIEKTDKNKPFMAMCHFKATHEPFDYPDRFKNLYKDDVIPSPDTLFDKGAKITGRSFTGQSIDKLKERYLRSTREYGWSDYSLYPGLPFSVEGLNKDQARMKTYQKFIKDFMRCGAAIDDNIGKILDYLDKSGLAENTVVIYTADQGYFLGEHGWFDKRMIYEESIHMPFVIRYPKEIPAGTRNSDIIENVDFAPLFADYAGLKVPDCMQGRSFRQNLKGNTPKNWRKYGYYRYWQHLSDRPAHFGIRGKRYKLAFFYGKLLEEDNDLSNPRLWDFFDLKKDPHELHNAYNEPEYHNIIKQMKKEILRQRKILGDTDDDNPQMKEVIDKHFIELEDV